MQKLKLLIIVFLILMSLSGCAQANEVENQAYAIVLGIDKTDENGLEITAQIPKISSQGENGSSGDSENPSYLTVSAKGDNTAEALEALQWAMTRELNLSHLKMVVVSDAFAREKTFADTISLISETFQLYTSAKFVVCDDTAKEFINGQETIIGTRLSTEIEAMLEHYIIHGYIPNAIFADIYYGVNTFFSDPIAIWGFSLPEYADASETAKDKPVFSLISPDMKNQTKTASNRCYLGAAVFKNGIMVDKLENEDMLITNLLLGDVDTFNYFHDEATYQLIPLKKPRIQVDTNNDEAQINIEIYLSAIQQNADNGGDDLESVLKEDILKTIKKCQKKGIEPFGFAEKAAIHFFTIQDWLEYDWRNRFSNAGIEIDLHITYLDA